MSRGGGSSDRALDKRFFEAHWEKLTRLHESTKWFVRFRRPRSFSSPRTADDRELVFAVEIESMEMVICLAESNICS